MSAQPDDWIVCDDCHGEGYPEPDAPCLTCDAHGGWYADAPAEDYPEPELPDDADDGDTITITALDNIRIDGGTQARVALDPDAIREYADAYRNGEQLPALVVFDDGSDLWLVDGFHRYEAALRAGLYDVPIRSQRGALRDAVLASVGANVTHGVRRTNRDKRKAVGTLLSDPEWSAWSDREIARATGTTHPFVGRLRKEREGRGVVTVTTPDPRPTSASWDDVDPLEDDEGAGGSSSSSGAAPEPTAGPASPTGGSAEVIAPAAAPGPTAAGAPAAETSPAAGTGEERARPPAMPPDDLPPMRPELAAQADVPISERADYDGDSWSTPLDVIEDARAVLGTIDLDPATNPTAQARIRATMHFTKADDGLAHPWHGRVWLNPPYSRPAPFTQKLVEEYSSGHVTAALVLVNNCTDTVWFQALLARFPVCFTSGRIAYLQGDEQLAQTRQGQAIFYLGPDVDRFLRVFAARGTVVWAIGVAP